MIRTASCLLVALAFASPLAGQTGARMNERDIVAIVEKTLDFAVKDSVLTKSTQSRIMVDVDLSLSVLRAKSRLPIETASESVRVIPPRLVRANFFDYYECPTRSISVRCEMKREGEFLTVYAAQANDDGDELLVWVSFSAYRSGEGGHVRTVARALKFRRLSTDAWQFISAGDYLVT